MRLLFIFLLFLFQLSAKSQAVLGIITDSQGNALPFVNVFVPELKKGTTSNADGVYRLQLPAGEWKIEFRSIGYTTLEKIVTLGNEDVKLDVLLNETTYRIGEIKVMASGEDPAVYIMRRAIAMAPYYKNQVSEYSSSVYLKGTGKIGKVPKLMKKTLEKQGVKTNETFSVESLSNIEFKLPNQLKQEVIAQRTSGQDNSTSPMPMITSNLYNSSDYGIVSPFDRQALSAYQFRLLGMFEDQGRMINRIQVTPRQKGNEFFEGILNVADGYWSAHSADLLIHAPMMSMKMKQVYGPVDVNTWMPVSLSFDISLTAMGFEMEFVYVASISDYQITLNPALDHSFAEKQRLLIAEEERDAGVSSILVNPQKSGKNDHRIQQLLEKQDMSKRESRELNRLLQKEIKASAQDEPLEIELPVLHDSIQVERDSMFWETIRPVPLADDEIKGFARKDSLKQVQSEPAWRDSVETARRRFKPQHLIMGATYSYHPRGSASRNTLSVPGIAGMESLAFNTVDGLKLKLPFSWVKSDTLGHRLGVNPLVSYAFARKMIEGSLYAGYMYNGAKRASVSISGGRVTTDFNRQSGMAEFENDFQTLWYELNYKKFYRRDFVEISQQSEISNGLNYKLSVSYANRVPLQNNSDYKFIDWNSREYTSNTPSNQNAFYYNFEQSRSFEIAAGLTWTPRQRYYYLHGFKQYASSRFPTFTLIYRHAIQSIDKLDADSDFAFLEAGVSQHIRSGAGGEFRYNVSAGTFLNNNHVHFSDFRHFATYYSFLPIQKKTSIHTTNPFYNASTQNWFLEARPSYESVRILVKRLPFLANTILSEEVDIYFLHNDIFRNYTELGYSIKNIFAVFYLKGIAAFQSGKFESAGLKIGVNLPGM